MQASSVGDCSSWSCNEDTECLLEADRSHLRLSNRIKDKLKRRSSFQVIITKLDNILGQALENLSDSIRVDTQHWNLSILFR